MKDFKHILLILVLSTTSLTTSFAANQDWYDYSMASPFPWQSTNIGTETTDNSRTNSGIYQIDNSRLFTTDGLTQLDSSTDPTLPGNPTTDPPIGAIPLGDGLLLLYALIVIFVIVKLKVKQRSS